MYTSRRVKVRDLVGIANFHLAKRGKPLLKSSTTVLNRSKPSNKRSIQAKHHKGIKFYITPFLSMINDIKKGSSLESQTIVAK